MISQFYEFPWLVLIYFYQGKFSVSSFNKIIVDDFLQISKVCNESKSLQSMEYKQSSYICHDFLQIIELFLCIIDVVNISTNLFSSSCPMYNLREKKGISFNLKKFQNASTKKWSLTRSIHSRNIFFSYTLNQD